MDKLVGAVNKVKAANIVEKGSSTDAPSSVMVAVRCRPSECATHTLAHAHHTLPGNKKLALH